MAMLLVSAATATLGACGKAEKSDKAIEQGGGLPTAPVVQRDTQPFSPVRPISVGLDGRVLSVKAVGGDCLTPSLSARETSGTVALTIKVVARENRGQACTTNAELVPLKVTLTRSLGVRKLIDGATGRPITAPVVTSSDARSRLAVLPSQADADGAVLPADRENALRTEPSGPGAVSCRSDCFRRRR
ncbi:hypothetical protein [Streptomyces alanosinicus]|uniref:hypothetical protein n=1 Tax=Streptomyces alanosinicus TaxID=68171 RepID=UPI001673FE1F|nr:hypothetical protein [Streptomyces alanosinicus]